MHQIQAGQVKAARAILDWSQEDLAEAANLSIRTIRNMEMGTLSVRRSTQATIRQVIEKLGVEFTAGEGVKRRPPEETKIFEGPNSCEDFLEDLHKTIKQKGGDIVCYIRTQEMLMQSCGIANEKNLGALERLSNIASVRCLISSVSETPLSIPSFQLRVIAKHQAGPLPYYIYGDKCAIVMIDAESGYFKFMVLHGAQEYRQLFLALWEVAVPVTVQIDNTRRRT